MVPKGVAYLLFKRVSGTVVITGITHVCIRFVGGVVRSNSYNITKGQSTYEINSRVKASHIDRRDCWKVLRGMTWTVENP